MMQTLNSSKTAQILARYRPIAPKPPDHDLPENNSDLNSNPNSSSDPISNSPCMPQNIRDSPYLRSVWPHLQARPTRTRKRGRTSVGPTLPCKRSRPTYTSPKNLSSFLASPSIFLPNLTTTATTPANVKDLDLNKQVPSEKDLLQQLQVQELQDQAPCVFKPRPIGLVPSAIVVQPESTIINPAVVMHGTTKAEEIEKQVESETLPIVISDSNNKVRLANSAYKKLVGQPECCWLDSIGCDCKVATCNRICGEVMLQIPESVGHELISSSSSKGFFCLVVIEWGNSEYKSSITTSGEAVRLFCESRDYMFAWRFHTQGAVVPVPKF